MGYVRVIAIMLAKSFNRLKLFFELLLQSIEFVLCSIVGSSIRRISFVVASVMTALEASRRRIAPFSDS
jgi:hypothetical protein